MNALFNIQQKGPEYNWLYAWTNFGVSVVYYKSENVIKNILQIVYCIYKLNAVNVLESQDNASDYRLAL